MYLMLHSQRDALYKRLCQITESLPGGLLGAPERICHPSSLSANASISFNSFISANPSRSLSVTSHYLPATFDKSATQGTHMCRKDCSALRVNNDDHVLSKIGGVEVELHNINEQIKHTLMDLLNCESVKMDKQYRVWAQTRLMEIEKEMGDHATGFCRLMKPWPCLSKIQHVVVSLLKQIVMDFHILLSTSQSWRCPASDYLSRS